MNKKGGVFDIVVALVSVTVLITSLFIGHYLFSEFRTNPQLMNDPNSAIILNRTESYFENTADNLVVFLWVGMLIASIATALVTRVNRALFFFNIITSMFFIVISVALMYWYDALEDAATLSTIVQYYPRTHFLMEHLALFTLIGVILIAMALFAGYKSRTPEFA